MPAQVWVEVETTDAFSLSSYPARFTRAAPS